MVSEGVLTHETDFVQDSYAVIYAYMHPVHSTQQRLC